MDVVSNGGRPTTLSDVIVRTTMATVLSVAAIAALAIIGLIQGNERAAAQSGRVTQAVPSITTIPLAAPSDFREGALLAFGHVEFDQDPAGVPGFSSWPPASQRP